MLRLCWVCKWTSGWCRIFSPLIHILEGENVWHQVIRPIHFSALFASWHTAVASAGVLITGLNTTETGMADAASRLRAISKRFVEAFQRLLRFVGDHQ